ncbi:MAG: hypothetical protein FWE48_03225 [Coriobacteriia bacterium]|nr:hypothetical protein [Coriobacteriia bacterium]MCL2746087.1 hypothetical protein [Coriobacteriia bacterium]MCL2870667.1 hypothetical protein [Coriobacteriia bacterium]
MINLRLGKRAESTINPISGNFIPWSKGTNRSSGQFLITVAGAEPKAGATHLALSLAVKAHKRNINCALIVSHESFEALRQYYVLSVREDSIGAQSGAEKRGAQSSLRQFASFAGLSIMAGVLPSDLEGYQLIIWDCGSLPKAQRRFSRGNLCCLVSGGQPWELIPLDNLLNDMSYDDMSRHVICVRGVTESELNHIKQQMAGKVRCLGILHKPDWTDVRLREDLVTILRLTEGCN